MNPATEGVTIERGRDSKRIRHAVRDGLVLVAAAFTAPLWLPVRIVARFASAEGIFLTCSQILSLFPGLLGIFLRRGFFMMTLEECAWDCSIEFGTWIAHRRVSIGRNVYIGGRCTLGMCSIGENALIGSNVDILAGRYTHRFDDPNTPICDQDKVFRQVRIGQNAWIGNSAVVMDDVGDDSIIGAGSVVVKPIPAGTVAAGNPCVVKKHREPKGDGSILADPFHGGRQEVGSANIGTAARCLSDSQ